MSWGYGNSAYGLLNYGDFLNGDAFTITNISVSPRLGASNIFDTVKVSGSATSGDSFTLTNASITPLLRATSFFDTLKIVASALADTPNLTAPAITAQNKLSATSLSAVD